MGVVIVQSKPVAQVYRLFGALVALLLVMVAGFSVARWRATQSEGSPYGGLAPVATGGSSVPTIVAPARLAALPAQKTSPAPMPAPEIAPAPQAPPAPAPLATHQPDVAQVAAPAAMTASAPVAATPAPLDPSRAQPRVIAMTRATPGDAPQPAPAAAVAAATAAAQVAPAPKPEPTVLANAVPTAADAAAAPASGLININTASVEVLNHLPGAGHIGKTIAQHRPYTSVQDLLSHRVLRASDFAKIRAAITTN